MKRRRRRRLVEGAVAQRLGVAADRGERRLELVRDVGHEVAAHLGQRGSARWCRAPRPPPAVACARRRPPRLRRRGRRSRAGRCAARGAGARSRPLCAPPLASVSSTRRASSGWRTTSSTGRPATSPRRGRRGGGRPGWRAGRGRPARRPARPPTCWRGSPAGGRARRSTAASCASTVGGEAVERQRQGGELVLVRHLHAVVERPLASSPAPGDQARRGAGRARRSIHSETARTASGRGQRGERHGRRARRPRRALELRRAAGRGGATKSRPRGRCSVRAA